MTPDRIVYRAPARLSHRFSQAGAGDVSAHVVDALGRVVYDDAAEQVVGDKSGEPTGEWQVEVPAVKLPDPTELTVEWRAQDGWVETDYLEVAGGRYTTVAEVRGASTIAGHGLDRGRVTDDLIEAAIVEVERRIDEATEVAHVPRLGRASVGPDGLVQLQSPVRSIVGVLEDGQPVHVHSQPVTTTGLHRLWGAEGRRLEVLYIHGHSRPPADLAAAATRAARTVATTASNPSAAPAGLTQVSGGGYVFNWAHQADLGRGRPFGVPDIDTVVMSHRQPRPVVA